MRIPGRSHGGFSVLEILLVIAMVAVTAAMAGPFLSGAFSQGELTAIVDKAVDSLKEARTSAMTGREGGKYGVHFETGQLVFFTGETYSAADPDNIVHELSGLVEITAIDISGGGSDIRFASVSGSPIVTGSVEFTDTSGGSKTVSVNEAGLIDVQ